MLACLMCAWFILHPHRRTSTPISASARPTSARPSVTMTPAWTTTTGTSGCGCGITTTTQRRAGRAIASLATRLLVPWREIAIAATRSFVVALLSSSRPPVTRRPRPRARPPWPRHRPRRPRPRPHPRFGERSRPQARQRAPDGRPAPRRHPRGPRQRPHVDADCLGRLVHRGAVRVEAHENDEAHCTERDHEHTNMFGMAPLPQIDRSLNACRDHERDHAGAIKTRDLRARGFGASHVAVTARLREHVPTTTSVWRRAFRPASTSRQRPWSALSRTSSPSGPRPTTTMSKSSSPRANAARNPPGMLMSSVPPRLRPSVVPGGRSRPAHCRCRPRVKSRFREPRGYAP